MRALCWCGTTRVRVEDLPDPKILNPRDAVVRVRRPRRRPDRADMFPAQAVDGESQSFFACIVQPFRVN